MVSAAITQFPEVRSWSKRTRMFPKPHKASLQAATVLLSSNNSFIPSHTRSPSTVIVFDICRIRTPASHTELIPHSWLVVVVGAFHRLASLLAHGSSVWSRSSKSSCDNVADLSTLLSKTAALRWVLDEITGDESHAFWAATVTDFGFQDLAATKFNNVRSLEFSSLGCARCSGNHAQGDLCTCVDLVDGRDLVTAHKGVDCTPQLSGSSS